MTSDREIEPVLRAYAADYSPTRIEPLGSAGGMSGGQFWRIESPRGTLLLRRWPSEHPTRQRLRFIHDVLFHAADRGITFLALPLRTTTGETFVFHNGALYELAPWMPGTADFDRAPNEQRLRAAMAALANFHLAAATFPTAANRPPAGAPPAISRHLSRLQELANGRIEQLSQAIDKSQWPDFGRIAQTFLAALPQLLPRAIERLMPLASVSLPVQPCLRDIWHDHVLFTGDEVTGIIDYGAVDFDTPVTDIARLLGSLVGDDVLGWRKGLQAYSTIRPLAAEEVSAAQALSASGTILAGCNWIRWIYVDRRRFDDQVQIMNRFKQITMRCTVAATR